MPVHVVTLDQALGETTKYMRCIVHLHVVAATHSKAAK